MDATNTMPRFVDDVNNSGERTLPMITELEMGYCLQYEEELIVDNSSGLEILNNCANESDRVFETEEIFLKVPEIGMIFHSLEEAFKFYKAYGYYSGFGVRKRSNHNFYGQKTRCVFTCCKEGKPYETTKTTKSRRKPVIRTGCKARFVIVDRCLNSNWVVDDFFLEHNHDLEPQMVRFMRCYRELPLTVQRQLIANDKAGVLLLDSSTHTTNIKRTLDDYYVESIRHANEIIDIGGVNDETRAYTLNALQELKEKIKDFCGHGVSNIIKDPVHTHPKGCLPTKRFASNHERKGKKSYKLKCKGEAT